MASPKADSLHLAHPKEFASAVLGRMQLHGIRHLPVVDADTLVGIVSDRDLLLHAWSGQRQTFPDDLTVAEIMTKNPTKAPYGTPLASIAELMLEKRVDAVPLVGPEGELAGIVTSTDILRLVATRDDELSNIQHSQDFMNQFRWDMPEII